MEEEVSQPPVRDDNPTPRAIQSIRSCLNCSKRKIGCDRALPCTNCSKNGVECVFPRTRRKPRLVQKSTNATDLLGRLNKLEEMVQRGFTERSNNQPVQSHGDSSGSANEASHPRGAAYLENSSNDPWLNVGGLPDKGGDGGKLFTKDGSSRYIENGILEKILEMRDLIDVNEDGVDQELARFPESNDLFPGISAANIHTHSLIFGDQSRSVVMNSDPDWPLPNQMLVFWMIYEENVDPVIKLLHRPTTRALYLNASHNPIACTKPVKALMFAIFFSAVCSLDENRCQELLGEERYVLASRFRAATETVLSQTELLNSLEIQVLQAFMLYLHALRAHDQTRLVWSLSGLAAFLAQAQGLHRDGSELGLSPFETQIRRRLWWQICYVNHRATEDHGAGTSRLPAMSTTKLPLHINDEDIHPSSPVAPQEREGGCEMTWPLIYFRWVDIETNLQQDSPVRNRSQHRTAEEEEQVIRDAEMKLVHEMETKCDMAIPVFRLAIISSRTKVAKQKLMSISHKLRASVAQGRPLDGTLADQMLTASIDIIRDTIDLLKDAGLLRYSWFIRTNIQWHTVAYTLQGLCTREPDELYKRAWAIIDGFFECIPIDTQRRMKGMLWKPMKRLYATARARRIEFSRRAETGVTEPMETANMLAATGLLDWSAIEQPMQSWGDTDAAAAAAAAAAASSGGRTILQTNPAAAAIFAADSTGKSPDHPSMEYMRFMDFGNGFDPAGLARDAAVSVGNSNGNSNSNGNGGGGGGSGQQQQQQQQSDVAYEAAAMIMDTHHLPFQTFQPMPWPFFPE